MNNDKEKKNTPTKIIRLVKNDGDHNHQCIIIDDMIIMRKEKY